MVENNEKKVKEIHGPKILHGKRARLMRGKTEVVGVLLANDHQTNSKNFAFQYVDSNGVKCISQVTNDELENINDALLEY